EQHRLPMLELRSEPHHRVEHAACEPPGAALDEAHMPSQSIEFGISGPESPADPARRIPPPIERRGPCQTREPFLGRLAGHDDITRDLQMFVYRLAGDEQMHDLG